MVTEKQACRACGKKFGTKILLSLGEQSIVDFPLPGEQGRGRAPLQLVSCTDCGLVQLRHTVDADTLYKTFWYRSSLNPQMREALEDIVRKVQEKASLVTSDIVCDIGSNDGQLLLSYEKRLYKIGFEPADALAVESAKRLSQAGHTTFDVIPNYFNVGEALAASGSRTYQAITAIAMFYDLDDPKDFLFDVKACLALSGVFVIQMNYLGLMIKNLTFDNISHEHLCYYSLSSLNRLVQSVGLQIFDVELNDVNGGSIRVFICHDGIRSESRAVQELLMQEAIQLSETSIRHFAEVVASTSVLLRKFLLELKRAGKKVYVYGASTRGLTLLQSIFPESAQDFVIAAAERDERKYGRTIAGIPIVPEQEARDNADYMLVLPYHFWKSIREREKAWLLAGGKFIIPLPYPKIMKYVGEGPMGLVPTAHDLEHEMELVRG